MTTRIVFLAILTGILRKTIAKVISSRLMITTTTTIIIIIIIIIIIVKTDPNQNYNT